MRSSIGLGLGFAISVLIPHSILLNLIFICDFVDARTQKNTPAPTAYDGKRKKAKKRVHLASGSAFSVRTLPACIVVCGS